MKPFCTEKAWGVGEMRMEQAMLLGGFGDGIWDSAGGNQVFRTKNNTKAPMRRPT